VLAGPGLAIGRRLKDGPGWAGNWLRYRTAPKRQMTDRATFTSTLRRALTVPVPPPRHPFMDVSGGLPPVEYAPGPSGVEAFTENLTLLARGR